MVSQRRSRRVAWVTAIAALLLAPLGAAARLDLGGGLDDASTGWEPVTAAVGAATRFAVLAEEEDTAPWTALAGSGRGVAVSSPKGTRVWTASALTDHGLPRAAARAYRAAARTMAEVDPACRLPWTLLAGIGRVESDHGRYGGATLGTDGVSRPRIIGVPLNGVGPVAAIRDTDNGRLDGDKVWDRAVGPMQFIPSTWATAGRDGDRDGVASPDDIDDAALAAAGYLCSGTGSVLGEQAMAAAVFSYNHDDYYVALVLAFERGYRTGVFVLPPPPASVEERAGRDRDKRRAASGGRDRRAGEVRRGSERDRKKEKPRPGREATAGPSGSDAPTAGPGPRRKKRPQDEPAPSPSRTPSPTRSPRPSPSPTPEPAAPELVALSGRLVQCDEGWCIAGTPLDLGPAAQLARQAAADHDDDGDVETNAEELAGLADRTVDLQVEKDSGVAVVYTINGEDYRYADGSFA